MKHLVCAGGLLVSFFATAHPPAIPDGRSSHNSGLVRPTPSPEGHSRLPTVRTFASSPQFSDIINGILRGQSSAGHDLNGDGVSDMGDAVRAAIAPYQVSLLIESDAPQPIHQQQLQTITFTFDTGVFGFDNSDIHVSGGIHGALQTISPSVYTLPVAGLGGPVSVTVANGAATSLVNNGFTQGATFSNFYQDTWTLNLPGNVPMELIRIPAGTFIMGSPTSELSHGTNENEHQVTISQDFYLGKTEVTQAQWLAVQGTWPGAAPSATFGLGDDYPTYNVSHDDVQLFMSNLDIAVPEPGTFRLPTEAQWEYACRAGTTTRFNFGNGFGADENCSAEAERTDNMWYYGNNGSNGSPDFGAKIVAQKPANAWGLHDMHGNMWEWCADWFGLYAGGPVIDPTGPLAGSFRLIRGGHWNLGASQCRSAQRIVNSPSTRDIAVGFRVLAVRSALVDLLNPLTITSSETEPVHKAEAQTLTFRFAGAVSDFTADDVQLTGAAKGTFTALSAMEYTLEITGAGGIINVDVAQGAATATFPYSTTGAQSFSNFYQDTWTLNLPGNVPMELIRIPAGTFIMGSPTDEPSRSIYENQHQVTISQDFYLGKTEVTQAQWAALQSFPQAQDFPGDDMPVHQVSWEDCQLWLTALDTAITEPGSFALPTQAQWEYACRAGTTTRFSFGNGLGADQSCSPEAVLANNMWFCGNNSPNGTKPVGQKPANAWCLQDMHGNVWEWCADWFERGYPPGPLIDPTGPETGTDRVTRGGSWANYPEDSRSARQLGNDPADRDNGIGFRVLAVQ